MPDATSLLKRLAKLFPFQHTQLQYLRFLASDPLFALECQSAIVRSPSVPSTRLYLLSFLELQAR